MSDQADVRAILVYRKGIAGPSSWLITQSFELRPWVLALDLGYQGSYVNDTFVPAQETYSPNNHTIYWTWRTDPGSEFDLHGQQSDPVAKQEIPYFHCEFKVH
ncbi:MAG: hypothetical protein ACJ763_12915 [Bdellovibrionia bacterium]